MNDSLYKEELLDHYRHPRNSRIIEKANAVSQVLNPSCGDRIGLQLMILNGRIADIAFQGAGCVISQAAASMLTEHALHKSVISLEALTKDDMLTLVGIPLGPTRLRCALLSLEALHNALAAYKK